jgi:hypothetical protein
MVAQCLELTRHDLEAEIVQRSWEDNEFRKEFIAHPTEISDADLEMIAGGVSPTLVAAASAISVGIPLSAIVAGVSVPVSLDVGGW